MKTIKLLCAGLVLTSLMACDQKNTTPKEVTVAFTSKFPIAKSVKWHKESETEWEAEFKMNKIEYSANFEANGTWKETEHEIKISEVPINVKNALMESYPECDIEEVEISETNKGIVYEFAIENEDQELEIALNSEGTIVKKEVKKEDDEED
jgi:uncharacterized membrane protein YkoI